MSETEGLPPAQRQRVMFCILLGALLVNLDGAIANVALPTIAHDFGASPSSTVWIVNGYQLAMAVCLLPTAAIGEIRGAKSVYAFGLAIFTAASLVCALAPNLGTLVGARLAQGIGGACISALGPALIREIYPRRMLAQGLSLIALCVAVSGAAGPTIAALILSVATWPWLFLVNVPLGVVAVPLFLSATPASDRRDRPLDIVGAMLNAAALGLVVIGVDMLGGEHPGYGAVELAVGGIAFALLIVQQRRNPLLLPLDLMRIPLFVLSFATSICSYTAQILAYVSLPFLFQTVLHRSQTATGLLVTPWPLTVAISAVTAGRLATRFPVTVLGSFGLAVLSCGLLLMVALPAEPSNADIVWRMAICGLGFGFFQTPNNIAMMTSAPVERAGAAGGMLAVARVLGWSFGSALVTLIFGLAGAAGARVCLMVAAGFAIGGALVGGVRLAKTAR